MFYLMRQVAQLIWFIDITNFLFYQQLQKFVSVFMIVDFERQMTRIVARFVLIRTTFPEILLVFGVLHDVFGVSF